MIVQNKVGAMGLPSVRRRVLRATVSLSALTGGLLGLGAIVAPNATMAQTTVYGNNQSTILAQPPTASGSLFNIAIGAASNSSGTDAGNIATGPYANASGSGTLGNNNNFNSAYGNLSNASGSGAAANTALGAGSNASGDRGGNTALGINSNANGLAAANVSIGSQANASGDNTSNVAIGAQSVATGTYSTSLGAHSQATGANAIAIGGSATAGAGAASRAIGANSVSLGSGSTAALANSVALGAGSTTAGASSIAGNAANGVAVNAGAVTAGSGNVLSVGAAGAERQVQNVGAGAVNAASTDAVNGSQLFAVASNVQALATGGAGPVQYSTPGVVSNAVQFVGAGGPVVLNNVAAGSVAPTSLQAINGSQLYGTAASVARNFGGGSTVAANGTVTAPSYAIGGRAYNDVGSALGALQNDVNRGLQRANGGIAAAMASSGIRYDDRPGKISTGIGAAGWRGQAGVAVGIGATSEDSAWRVNAAVAIAPSSSGRTDAGVLGGLSYTWN